MQLTSENSALSETQETFKLTGILVTEIKTTHSSLNEGVILRLSSFQTVYFNRDFCVGVWGGGGGKWFGGCRLVSEILLR